MGTSMIACELGRMSGPPTEKPYAVLPVAVATMRRSAGSRWNVVGSEAVLAAMASSTARKA